jgi:hypothetical protein
MLRTLFQLNGPASMLFAIQLGFMPNFFFTNLGFTDISDSMKAVAFMWGVAIQPGMALTQYTNASLPTHHLIAHGKIYSAWWTLCGLVFASKMLEYTMYVIANIGFMLAYGAAYYYYSFVKPPTDDVKTD